MLDQILADTGTGITDLDPDDLATAHRVLVEVVERANRLRGELQRTR
jgi:hypothetical protein